jgi:hypothetical protein
MLDSARPKRTAFLCLNKPTFLKLRRHRNGDTVRMPQKIRMQISETIVKYKEEVFLFKICPIGSMPVG